MNVGETYSCCVIYSDRLGAGQKGMWHWMAMFGTWW